MHKLAPIFTKCLHLYDANDGAAGGICLFCTIIVPTGNSVLTGSTQRIVICPEVAD